MRRNPPIQSLDPQPPDVTVITQRRPSTSAADERPPGRPLGELLRRTVWLWPVLVTALVVRYQAGRPQLWRDELATWSAVTRSSGGLARLTEHLDAVLEPYYRFMQVWVGVVGDSALAMRTPSILAAAATAGVVVALGTTLGSSRAGVLAGLLYAILPTTSRYGQEARPYALASLAAATATLFLLLALQRKRWFYWAGYAVALSMLGALHLVALVLLTGHLVAVAYFAYTGRSWRPFLWAGGAVFVALAPLIPLALHGHQQVGLQLGTRVHPPDIYAIATLPDGIFGSATIGGAMLALAVIGALTGDRRAGLFGATVLVPVLVFLAASEFAPLYTLRYMVFIAPLGCALAGLALARVRLAPALAVVLLLGFLCLKEQDLARVSHEGRGAPIVDYRGAARVIAQNRQPADVIVYDRTGWQFADIGIEYYLRGDTPTDVLAKSSRDAVGSYWTPEVADPAAALAAHKRVWAVVPNNLTTHKPDPLPAATVAALTQHYRAARTWHVSGITVWLYERTT